MHKKRHFSVLVVGGTMVGRPEEEEFGYGAPWSVSGPSRRAAASRNVTAAVENDNDGGKKGETSQRHHDDDAKAKGAGSPVADEGEQGVSPPRSARAALAIELDDGGGSGDGGDAAVALTVATSPTAAARRAKVGRPTTPYPSHRASRRRSPAARPR